MRSVVITGVSRGLGSALFNAACDRGAPLLALGRRFSPRQQELATANPGRVILRPADLRDPTTLPNRDEFESFCGTSSVLILNAAVIQPLGLIGTLCPGAVSAAITTNLVAPVIMANEFIAATRACHDVSVVFIGSGAARTPIAGWSPYCAAKAGGAIFAAALSAEHADDARVNVATIDPGMMDTGMQAEIRAADLPGGARFAQAWRRGELTDPRIVAERIANTYFDGPPIEDRI